MRKPTHRHRHRSRTASGDFASFEAGTLLRKAEEHHRAGQVGPAVKLCQQVLAHSPNSAPAMFLLGRLAAQTAAFEVAIGFFERVLVHRPDAPEVLLEFGLALKATGRVREALPMLERARKLAPSAVAILTALGDTLLELGHTEDALASYQTVLAVDPANAFAGHMVQALKDSPEPDPAYVASIFDGYADIFDTHVTGTLQYRIPSVIAELLERHLPRRRYATALDLGCGTGLVAKALEGRFDEMDGVDLSPRMIEKARATGLYRRLATGGLEGFLNEADSGSADLVVAADVFVYVGTLHAVFREVTRVLSAGGVFAFSLEQAEGPKIAARSSGRFAHPPGYGEELAEQNGLTVVATEPLAVRQENNRPLQGRLLLLRAL